MKPINTKPNETDIIGDTKLLTAKDKKLNMQQCYRK